MRQLGLLNPCNITPLLTTCQGFFCSPPARTGRAHPEGSYVRVAQTSVFEVCGSSAISQTADLKNRGPRYLLFDLRAGSRLVESTQSRQHRQHQPVFPITKMDVIDGAHKDCYQA